MYNFRYLRLRFYDRNSFLISLWFREYNWFSPNMITLINHLDEALCAHTENSGYFGKLFSRSKQHQIGFITRRKKLRKKSPTNICAIVNRVSITVNLTISWPNIVSQHNWRSFSCSFTSLLYLFLALSQLSKTDSKIWDGSSPGIEVLFALRTYRLQIVLLQPRSSRGTDP